MYVKQEYFAGFMDGWLLGMSPVDFVLPVGFMVWILLLYILPLYQLDTEHKIGGLMYAIYFAIFGALICVVTPKLGGKSMPLKVDVIICLSFIALSINRWNRKIFANIAIATAEIGERKIG